MSLLEELYTASYKGAEFLVNRTSTSGGRKDVLNEYPDSNIQNIEDLGLLPRSYRVSAIIAEPNYTQKRDTLLRALESGGTGVLIHPFFGRIENMAARSFTLVEDATRLGDTTVECVFGASDTDGLPVQSQNTVSLVSNQKGIVNGNIATDIANLFKVTNSFTGNFQSASDKLNQIADTITTNVTSLTASPDQINNFSSLVGNFSSSINQLIADPEELGTTLQNIFEEIPGLYESPTEQTAVLSLFFDFGDDDKVINETTVGLSERKQNNDVLNNSVKGFALSEGYLSASQIEFDTVAEIEEVADVLEVAFQSVKSASGLS